MAGSLTAVLYEEMKVAWPFGAALRREASNHPPLHWLKTVVANGAGKVGTGSRQVGVGEMSDGRSLASAVRSVEIVLGDIKTRASVVSWDQPGGYPLTAQVVSGVQAA